MRTTLFAALATLLLGAPLSARADQEGQPMPKIKVDLPPPPEFKQSDVPEKHPDGTWSVFGIRRKIDRNLNNEVEVKGFLLELYVCPPDRAKCPKGKTCKPCEQPHFFLADKKGGKKEKAILVANYPIKPKPPKMPEAGAELVVKGKFVRNAGGFAASDGLLDHLETKMDGKPVVTGNVFIAAEEDLQKKVEAGEKKGLPKKRGK